MRILPAILLAVLIGCHPTRHHAQLPPDPPPPRITKVVQPADETDSIPRAIPVDSPAEVVHSKPTEETTITALNASLEDILFPYDRAELSPDAAAALARDTDLLLTLVAEFPHVKIIVEGHCDERGSAEYNLGLGDGRAVRVADFLRDRGVASVNLQIVSYGKEQPQCHEPTESCWQRNRRVHFTASRE